MMTKIVLSEGRRPAFLIGSFCALLAIFCNVNEAAHFLGAEPGIEPIAQKILIYTFKISIFCIGIAAIFIRKRKQLISSLYFLFLFQMAVLAFFFLMEAGLGLSASIKSSHPTKSIYAEFYKQHLHPFYYFFFPQKQEEISRINNGVVSIDANGFRGSGPAQRNGRKLAFIVGGSAAFGDTSSSDETTISGYLNRIQDKYHFVNAGVPSWNSTQEFYRISLELLDYDPELIIAYDGFNDALISLNYEGSGYPPGTPESYEYIERWVDDIRAGKATGPFLINRQYKIDFFCHTNRYLAGLVHPAFSLGKYSPGGSESDAAIAQDPPKNIKNKSMEDSDSRQGFPGSLEYCQRSAARYLKNIKLMERICNAHNCKFIAIWQPSFSQHKHCAYDNQMDAWMGKKKMFLNYFHDAVFRANESSVSRYDFSNIFDQYSDPIRLGGVFFRDEAHLTDKGNETIAAEILKVLDREGLIQQGLLNSK